MSQEFNITLNIAQIILLAGVIWGLAKMSGSLDTLKLATDKVILGLERAVAALGELTGRVSVLEDRGHR